MKTLNKPHYCWGSKPEVLTMDYEGYWLNHCMATHSMSIWASSLVLAKTDIIDFAVYICNKVNQMNPSDMPARIGFTYSPWHNDYWPEYTQGYAPPPTVPYTNDDHNALAEVLHFESTLNDVKAKIAASNIKYNCDIQLGLIMLNCERFSTRDADALTKLKIRMALDTITVVAQRVFPKVELSWYFHAVDMFDSKNLTYKWTGGEETLALCPEFYMLQYPDEMLRGYNWNVEYGLARTPPITNIIPYVSIGYGYKWKGDFSKFEGEWEWTTQACSLDDAYAMGKALAETDTEKPYGKVSSVVLHPYPLAIDNPYWDIYFNAYCQGAMDFAEEAGK